MSDAVIATSFIRDQTLRLLVVTLSLMMVPHITHLPAWVSISTGLLLGYRLLSARMGLTTIRRGLLSMITLGFVAALFISYHKIFGREVGVALLILMLALKTLELRTLRDVMVVICLGYFLVVTGFLYDQSIPMALYLTVTVLLLTTVLIDLNRLVQPATFNKRYWHHNLRLAGTMILQAVPIMLVLFILFPRINGPLWALPKDSSSASSGLSDTMSPGSINKLILSDDIAFRVRFDGAVPSPSERYWRGPVLWHYDGHTWSAATMQEKNSRALIATMAAGTNSYHYEITLEPHQRRWLFALDLPSSIPSDSQLTPDYQLITHKTIDQRKRFALTSTTNIRIEEINEQQQINGLQLPPDSSPRMHKLAQQWRDEANNETSKKERGDYIVERALSYFRTQPFVYTLLPDLLTRDPVDQFLFDSRKGFCEHYASAFVTLMRAAGIPARVVTGYLGGELNRFGDYMVVYQSDAHAWAEVWLEHKGWMRVDPTAAIAPERIESRINNNILRRGESVLFQTHLSVLEDLWLDMRDGWDSLNHYWQNMVIDYDEIRQKNLFSSLGFKDINWREMGIILLITFSLVISVVAIIILYQRPRTIDPVQKTYALFCRRMAHLGYEIKPHEGPHDFLCRITSELPMYADHVGNIIALYIQLRYDTNANQQTLAEFRRQVAAFKP